MTDSDNKTIGDMMEDFRIRLLYGEFLNNRKNPPYDFEYWLENVYQPTYGDKFLIALNESSRGIL